MICTKNFTERYYRDKIGWLKVSARGRKFRMTEEQVLITFCLLVVGELELEQAAGGVMEALDWGLQLAAQAIDLGTAGAGGVRGPKAGAEQFGFEAFAFALFELQG